MRKESEIVKYIGMDCKHVSAVESAAKANDRSFRAQVAHIIGLWINGGRK